MNIAEMHPNDSRCIRRKTGNEDINDSESAESQAPPSLDIAQQCIQELRSFALHTGDATFLDRVMDLQEMSLKIRMASSLKQSRINDFFYVIYMYI